MLPLALTAAALAALMLCAWLLALALRDVSIVDVVWGLAFVLVGWIAAASGDGDEARRLLVAALASIWGLRLAGYIALRKARHPGEDPRYAAMRERRGSRFALTSLFTVFLAQGVIAWVVSLPLQGAAMEGGALGALDAAAVVVFAVGLGFEAVGDAQLARFKADPANEGRIMDRGLWSLTRHPNYFGDACVWWGLWLAALAAGAWWAAAGPLLMTFLLVRVSGKDLTEKRMRERPGYADYVRRTSGFVPLPPRGSSR